MSNVVHCNQHIATGDLSPLVAAKLQAAAEVAVTEWLAANEPGPHGGEVKPDASDWSTDRYHWSDR
mgnify:CR=1 FL=1